MLQTDDRAVPQKTTVARRHRSRAQNSERQVLAENDRNQVVWWTQQQQLNSYVLKCQEISTVTKHSEYHGPSWRNPGRPVFF